MRNNEKSVAIFSNYFWTIYNFRKPLIENLIKNGYKVTAIGAEDEYVERTKALGCDIVLIKNLDPKSTGIIKELKLVLEISAAIRKLDCDYIFTFTIKPNLFAALTSIFNNKKIIITINGLGNVFTGEPLSYFYLRLFKAAFFRAKKIIFQNKEDYYFFKSKIGLKDEKILFVNGSGVDTEKFSFSKKASIEGERIVFLLACRLLKEKGIFEFLEAAERIKKRFNQVQFRLLGVPALNPSAINIEDLKIYKEKGIIESLSKTDDINSLLEEVDVLVLPSYYNEGVPKILLEGLSKGLPIITTNWVGCKETVSNNVNGYLIIPKSVDALEKAFEKMILLSVNERYNMRLESRKLALQKFTENKVLAAYLSLIQ